MNIGDLTATIGCDTAPLKRAEGDLRSFASTADSTFSSIIGKAAALAASLLTVSVAIKAISDAATTGMRVETMGVVMTQIGKNVGVSSEALKYFTEQVKSAGVTGMEAMSGLSKAMVLGLNLNQMKEFTTRVRDIAVGARDAQGNLLNTSQTLMRVMHGIESGQVEILRTMGISVRSQEEVYKSYGVTIGKTKDQMNTAEKAQAMLNEVMRASEPLAGSAAAADSTVGKQLASMARYSEEAKVALWDLFQPAMMQGVMLFTTAFKDLKTWADLNKVSLGALGIQVGSFVGQAGVAAMETVKWAAANYELIKSLTELYVISKVMTWINSLQIAIRASTAAVVIFTGVTQGLIPVLFGAATSSTIFASGATGMATAMTTATAAGAALNAMMITLLPAVVAVSAALAIYGAYKTFTEPGQARSKEESAIMAGVPGLEYVGGATDKQVAAAAAREVVGPPTPPAAVLHMNKVMEQQQKYVEEANAAQAKALAKNIEGAGKGGGKGGGGDAEINRLNSLFDTLTKDIARLSEGKLAEIEANYVKTVEQVYKKSSDRAHSEAEVEILAKQRAILQKEKLQEEFDLKMSKDSGNVFLSIQKDYEKDLSDFNGLVGAKEKTEANRAKKELDARQKFQEQVMGIQTASLSAIASAAPLLSQQIPIEKTLLDIEIKRGNLKMEEELRVLKINHMVSTGQEDELRKLKALEDQYKKYAQERKGLMLEGVPGGLKTGALDRDKESSTRTAQWTIDAMKGAETWLGETGAQSFVDYLHGKKTDLKLFFQDLGDSLIKQVWKMGTTKLFDTIWGAFSDKGPGKLGTASNPMIVDFAPGAAGIFGKGAKGIGGLGGGGTPDFEKRAEKIGMTVGIGGGNFGDWSDDIKGLKTYDKLYDQMIKGQTKDWKMTDKLSDKFWKDSKKDATTFSKMQDQMIDANQELFKADYLAQYQDGFTSMATGITGVWGMAQGIMTAAGVSGEAARYGAMVTYGMQGISLLTELAKGAVLIKAAEAAAAGYSSVMAALPWPINIPVAIAWGALSFAGTMAAGAIKSSAGGDWSVAATGPRVTHVEETILPAWAAKGWRDIVSREANGGVRPGENGGGGSVVYSPTYHINAIDARGVDAILAKHGKEMTKVINREVGRRGRRL